MYCKNCGSQILSKAVVCVTCGAPTDRFDKERKTPAVSIVLIASGYICAFLIPFLGVILGLITLGKGAHGHGIGIIALSVLFFLFWSLVFASL